MKKRLFIRLASAMAVVAASTAFSQENIGGWEIGGGVDGSVSRMTYANPATPLNNIAGIQVEINKVGAPLGGSVKFKNGFDRDLLASEVSFYWVNFNGAHALWAFLESQGKLVTFNAQSGAIPDSYYGKTVRIVSKAGKEYFGKIRSGPMVPTGSCLPSKGPWRPSRSTGQPFHKSSK
jgi:hypothetical protein